MPARALAPPALVLLATLTGPALQADEARDKVKEGMRLCSERKFNEALAAFREAAAKDPGSSGPLSGQALAFYEASRLTDDAHREAYRRTAETFARQALDLEDLDYVASGVLMGLEGVSSGSAHETSSKEAREAFEQAEKLFEDEVYEEAMALYRKALLADPAFTDAALYLADCAFMMRDYRTAETHFRKAVALEPGYAKAHRFLADCLRDMGRLPEAADAALDAVLAQPLDRTAWGRLARNREKAGLPALARFAWPAVAQLVKDPKGDTQIQLPDGQGKGDLALALAYGVALTAHDLKDGKAGRTPKPFERILEAWASTLKVARELQGKGDPPAHKGWAVLQDVEAKGHLKAALLLLGYHEAWRPEYEAWRKAEPKAARAFLEACRLRP